MNVQSDFNVLQFQEELQPRQDTLPLGNKLRIFHEAIIHILF